MIPGAMVLIQRGAAFMKSQIARSEYEPAFLENEGTSRHSGGADGPNAMQTCALMVAIAHYKDCGEWLNGKNEREECEALWRQAGGGPRKGAVRGENSFGVWRKHLGTAKDYYTHDFGKHIVNNILVARGLFEKPPKAD